jgi:hypothetical protein
MHRGLKIGLYVAFALGAGLCGWQFQRNYGRLMAAGTQPADTDLLNVRLPDYQKQAAPTEVVEYHLGPYGAGLVFGLVGLGLLLGNDLSHFFGSRTLKTFYNEEGEGVAAPDYEKAEEVWAKGEFLEAVQLMRDYLVKNPREQHVALRIAEIYEKDLNNPLAAALEYEEVLQQKLPPERWGWAAIHLCNLYTGKLHQMDKALELLRRIETDYGDTAAAEKARKRLDQLAEEGLIPAASPPPPEPEPPGPKLPPGFAPKKP